MSLLDSPSSYSVDASGMFRHIESLGSQLERAWHAAASLALPQSSISSVILAGMGGSASAADYLHSIAAPYATVPIALVREYRLPAYASTDTLVVVVSYSGTTEEALACFEAAVARGCPTLSITRGGDLAARTKAESRPLHIVAYDAPPRAALGHTLAPLLRLTGRVTGSPEITAETVSAAAAAHQFAAASFGIGTPTAGNEAKTTALRVARAAVPLLFGAEHLAAVALRARNQFAENAKTLATFEEVPEATHNTVVTLEDHGGVEQVGIGFDSPLLSIANRRRLEITCRLFEERGLAFKMVPLSGESLLADMMEATAFTDFVSCYLAIIRGLDPTPTANLTRMRTAVAGAAAPLAS